MILKDFFELFFPQTCINCKKYVEENEFFLCYACISEIPLTNFSYQPDNLLEISFQGRIELISATALMYYEKGGLVQKLIYELKYNNKPIVGSFFGKWLGEEMVASKRFEEVDVVIPMPIHKNKRKVRGYNQSEYFGRAIAESMAIAYNEELLYRANHRISQTFKNRNERMSKSENDYVLRNKKELINKHVLIVDDILTSGATLQSSIIPFLTVSGVKLSFASLAITP